MAKIRHLRASQWQWPSKKPKTPKPTDQTAELRKIAKHGRNAEQAGEPRWVNPHMYTKARQWTYTWNLSHCERNGGACAGCPQCLVGCEPTDLTFRQWLHDFEQRNRGGIRYETVEARVGSTETV